MSHYSDYLTRHWASGWSVTPSNSFRLICIWAGCVSALMTVKQGDVTWVTSDSLPGCYASDRCITPWIKFHLLCMSAGCGSSFMIVKSGDTRESLMIRSIEMLPLIDLLPIEITFLWYTWFWVAWVRSWQWSVAIPHESLVMPSLDAMLVIDLLPLKIPFVWYACRKLHERIHDIEGWWHHMGH